MVVSLGCGTSGEAPASHSGGHHVCGLRCHHYPNLVSLALDLFTCCLPTAHLQVQVHKHCPPSSSPPPSPLPASSYQIKGLSLSPVTWRVPLLSAAQAGTWTFSQLHFSHSCSFQAVASQNALLDLAALIFTLLLSNLSKVQIRSHHFRA